MVIASQNIVREALASWAETMMAGTLAAMRVLGGPVEAGEAPALPSCGLEWGTVVPMSEGSVVDFAIEGAFESWLIQYEEVACAFVWRAASAEDADLIAHEFVARAAILAQTSNPAGNRVLHFAVNLGGTSRGAKLYLEGVVEPPAPSDTVTRSLYTQRVPATVVYPSVYQRTRILPELNVGVSIDGAEYPLPAALPESFEPEEPIDA